MARPKGSKNKKTKVEEDVRDPNVTYAITNTPGRTLADTIRDSPEPPMSDEELDRLKKKPDWIWAGMLGPAMRLIARLDIERAKPKARLSPLD